MIGALAIGRQPSVLRSTGWHYPTQHSGDFSNGAGALNFNGADFASVSGSQVHQFSGFPLVVPSDAEIFNIRVELSFRPAQGSDFQLFDVRLWHESSESETTSKQVGYFADVYPEPWGLIGEHYSLNGTWGKAWSADDLLNLYVELENSDDGWELNFVRVKVDYLAENSEGDLTAEDTFTGDPGVLTDHTSDSGHSWVNFENYLSGTINLTGSGTASPTGGGQFHGAHRLMDYTPSSDCRIAVKFTNAITTLQRPAYIHGRIGEGSFPNLYTVQLYASEIRLYKRVGSTDGLDGWTGIGSGSGTYTNGSAPLVELIMRGDLLIVKVDGVIVSSVQDSSIASGKAGIGGGRIRLSSDGMTTTESWLFDSFTVYEL